MTLILLGLVGTGWAADGSAGYNKGFVIKEGDNSMKISGRVQPRYVFQSDGEFSELESAFEVTRARLKLGGTVMDPRISYFLQLDMGKGSVSLKDYLVSYDLTDSVRLTAGQFKRPGSRQQMTSTSAIQLVERAITDRAFGYGRDIGLMVGQDLGKQGGVEWALGLYNGTVDEGVFGPQLAFRAGAANSNDVYKESDLGGGSLRWGVGGGAMATFDADDGDDGVLVANVDYIVKVNHFAHTGAIYARMDQDGDTYGDLAYSLMGFHAQAGYALGGKVEPAARLAMLVPAEGDSTTEVGAGVNVYFKGHNWKWQTDVNSVTTGDEQTLLGRSQLQLDF